MINTNDELCMHSYGHDAFIYDNQYGDIMTGYAKFRVAGRFFSVLVTREAHNKH